jgi:putative phosphoribosyl transferase
MNAPLFPNRFEAGEFLAEKLKEHRLPAEGLVVLAIPRGGVAVALPIAEQLQAPLDIFVVRKLGVPGYEELAMGAIATGDVRVLNEEVIQRLAITEKMIEAVTAEEMAELHRRERLYRDGRKPLELFHKNAVLVDDGLATGASMRAAVSALRKHHPQSITVAVPVGSSVTCKQFSHEVDHVLCGKTPEPFTAVGCWYDDFTQITDQEVSSLMNRAAHRRRVRSVRSHGIESFAS